ncbi:MAG: hypothetical protein C0402_11260 [Thermodesulfovibrio sp.]|nr:hypothetical protein [Thermodesulfovibrio sp.]
MRRNAVIAYLALLVVLSLFLLRPIADSDFFWHLKTGEWTWENRQLMTKDIFSYTTPPGLTAREQIILTSYWLSQISYHLFYLLGGIPGIFVLRALLAAGILYFMVRRKHGDDALFAGLLVLCFIVILKLYPTERPQVFSFLFFAMLLYFMEKILDSRTSQPRTYVAMLPLLMLLWANFHGGVILGQGVIVLVLLTEGIKFLHPLLSPAGKQEYRQLLTAGLVGLAASLINPNTYHLTVELYRSSLYHTAFLLEYQSTVNLFTEQKEPAFILFWLLELAAGLGILLRTNKLNITEAALLAGTGYFAFTRMRYIPFFLIAALPAIGKYYSATGFLKLVRTGVFSLALFAAVFFSWQMRPVLPYVSSGTLIQDNIFPVSAVDFIAANNLRGNMYNYYDWGGYLIWRLSPERKVFIDGRVLNEHIFKQSLNIVSANSSLIMGQPAWKSVLNAYSINYVITRYIFPDNGSIVPLVPALLADSEWIPVFFESGAAVFVKRSPENYPVIRKYSIPREAVRSELSNLTGSPPP